MRSGLTLAPRRYQIKSLGAVRIDQAALSDTDYLCNIAVALIDEDRGLGRAQDSLLRAKPSAGSVLWGGRTLLVEIA